MPESEWPARETQGQWDFPKRSVPRVSRRQPPRTQPPMAVVGGAVFRPRAERQHRRVREHTLVPKEFLDEGAGRVTTAPKARGTQAALGEEGKNAFKFRSDQF